MYKQKSFKKEKKVMIKFMLSKAIKSANSLVMPFSPEAKGSLCPR
jgi:hypothetical protein